MGVQQGLKLSSWFSFDVIALFTFPSSKIQGWLVSVQRKKNFFASNEKFFASIENQEDKSFKSLKRLDHAHIFVNVSLYHDY